MSQGESTATAVIPATKTDPTNRIELAAAYARIEEERAELAQTRAELARRYEEFERERQEAAAALDKVKAEIVAEIGAERAEIESERAEIVAERVKVQAGHAEYEQSLSNLDPKLVADLKTAGRNARAVIAKLLRRFIGWSTTNTYPDRCCVELFMLENLWNDIMDPEIACGSCGYDAVYRVVHENTFKTVTSEFNRLLIWAAKYKKIDAINADSLTTAGARDILADMGCISFRTGGDPESRGGESDADSDAESDPDMPELEEATDEQLRAVGAAITTMTLEQQPAVPSTLPSVLTPEVTGEAACRLIKTETISTDEPIFANSNIVIPVKTSVLLTSKDIVHIRADIFEESIRVPAGPATEGFYYYTCSGYTTRANSWEAFTNGEWARLTLNERRRYAVLSIAAAIMRSRGDQLDYLEFPLKDIREHIQATRARLDSYLG